MSAETSAPSPVLKGAVYGMGVLLVAGLAALPVALWWKFGRSDDTAQPVATVTPQVQAIVPFDPRTLPLPAGTRIADMDLDGSVLVLRLTWVDGEGGGLLWLYDVNAQRVLGEYTIP